jgi:hypothetical protein
MYSNNREKGIVENFLVFSSGKREAVLEYLWLKFLWNELTRTEYQLFILSLKSSPDSEKKWSFLKLLPLFPKKALRKRLLDSERILGLSVSSKERYHGYKGIRIEIHRETRKLARTSKYSGYVRNISSIGKSKKSSLSDVLSDVLDSDIFMEEKIDWDSLLRVGPITLFPAWKLSLLDPDD